MEKSVLMSMPRMAEASARSLSAALGGLGFVSAGRDSALMLWAIFWLLVCSVSVVFVFSVAPPLRRRALQFSRQRPWLGALAVLAYFSLLPTFLLGVGILSQSNVHLSMLIHGQAMLFVRGIMAPDGRLSPIAVALICLWIGFVAAAVWLARRSRPRSPSSQIMPPVDDFRERPAARPRRWFLWLLVFTVSALALIAFPAVRLYSAQLVVERDSKANQASLKRLSEAQASLGKFRSGQGDARALLVDAARAAQLARALAPVGQRLDAAIKERNQRCSLLIIAAAVFVTVWLMAGARRLARLLRALRVGPGGS
jgi:cell division protein FtsB